jgi:hypothetical protein
MRQKTIHVLLVFFAAFLFANPGHVPAQPITRSPLTQADLSVITGNTQRPNGMVWFDDKIYTACTGDWTVYEIEADSGATKQYIYGVRNAHTLYAEMVDDQVSLWIPDFQANTLVQIVQGKPQIIAAQLDGPWGITPVGDDAFVVTNLLGNTATWISRERETRTLLTDLRSPTGAAAQDGILYIANTGSSRRAIEWFDLEALLDQSEAQRADRVGRPLVLGVQNITGLALDRKGFLYFAYALGTRGVVGRVDPAQCHQTGCASDQIEIVLYTELAVPLAGLTVSSDMKLYLHSIFSPDIYWVQLPD